MRHVAVGDGVRYAVHELGIGRPLLLLHGFTGSAASWDGVRSALLPERRVISVDLLGHGASDAPPDPRRHGVELQADDLAAVLQRIDAHPADVVGYSFGARVALALAIRHPEVIERLILESPSAGVDDPIARARRRALDERWARMLEHDGIEAFAEAWEAEPIFATRRRLPPDVREGLRQIVLANDPRGLAASLRGAGQGSMEGVTAHLPNLRQPTLVVAGELDDAGRSRATGLAAAVPGARLVIVPDAGHSPHLEAPEAFRRLVLAFLLSPVEVVS